MRARRTARQAGPNTVPGPAPARRSKRQALEGTVARAVHEFGSLLVDVDRDGSARLGDWLSGVAPGFAETPVRHPSHLAARRGVAALAHGQAVHLARSATALPTAQLRRMLAHESVHVAQQRGHGATGDRLGLELEAEHLAGQVAAGQAVTPRLSSPASTTLHDTPADRLAVERARRRLAVLRQFVDEYAAREGRRLGIAADRDPLLERRRQLDLDMPVPAPPEQIEAAYAGREREQITNLNRRPLRIELSEQAVRFHVRFHARFEGVPHHEAERRFPTLRSSLERGIRQIWNQRLRGMPLAGRRFELVPHIRLVRATAARNLDYWLISVRPSDDAPLEFQGEPLTEEEPVQGVPTAAAVTTVGGGVMSLPPSHIDKPDVLGHEVLHLFGLVDRYLIQEVRASPDGPLRGIQRTPMRETGGRPDPLATETGPVLAEDLNFLFEHLGVYQAEELRGLDVLAQLEARGLTLGMALAEIHRLEEVLRLGRDPHSLIRPRRDFRRQVLESVRDL